MKDDNKFIMDNNQGNDLQSQGMNEEYNNQDSSEFVYVNNDESYNTAPKKSIMDIINTKVLIIIGLVILLILFGFMIMNGISKKNKYNDWLNKFRVAAKEHVANDDVVREAIKDGDKDKIYFFELLDGKHISNSDLVNPKTKKAISKCNYIVVSTDINTAITYDELTLNQTACPKQKPIIKLLGDVEIKLVQGDTYVDAGAEAKDYDGVDLTEKIKQTGEVDTNVVGVYTLKYIVKNKAGIKSNTVARTVTVEAKPVVVVEPPVKPPVTPYVDRTRPTIATSGLPQTIKVGQTANFSISFADNSKLKSITYCTPNCAAETVAAKSRIKYLSYYGGQVGTVTIQATATDYNGNTASVTSTITVTADVDRIIPTVTWLNPITTIKAGTPIEIRVRFADNVAVSRYVLCLGTTCDSRTVTPSATVVAPIKATLNVKGSYVITGSAVDTSGNYSGNIWLGTFTVT